MTSTFQDTQQEIMSENTIKLSSVRSSKSTRSSLTEISSQENQYSSSKHSHSRSVQQTLILPSLDRKFAHKKVPSTQPNVNMKEALKDWLVGKQDVAIEDFIKKQSSSGIFYATPLSMNCSKKHMNTSLSSGFNIKQNDNKLEKLIKNISNSMSLSSVGGGYGDNITQNNSIFSKNQGGISSSANLVKRRICSTSQVQTSIDTADTHSTLDSSATHHSITSLSGITTATMISTSIQNSTDVAEIVSLQEIREAGRKATRKLLKKTSLDTLKDSGNINEDNSNKQTISESSAASNLSRSTKEVLPQKNMLESFEPINLAIRKVNLAKMDAQTIQPKDCLVNLKTPASNSNELTSISNVDTPIFSPTPLSSQSSQKNSSFATKSTSNQQLTPQDQPKYLISSSLGILKQITLSSAHPFSQATFTEAVQDYSKNNEFNRQSSMINIPSATPQSNASSQARRSIIGPAGNRIILNAANHRKTSRGILKSKSSLQITKKSVNFNERVVQYDI